MKRLLSVLLSVTVIANFLFFGGINVFDPSTTQVSAAVTVQSTSITAVKANNNGFDVTVSKVSSATGYQVRFATKSNFSNALTNTYSGNSKTTLTVTGRAYDTKYYVQARTYKTVSGKNYYSAWSSSKQVTTDSLYPDKTSISSVKANNNGFDVTVSKVSNATGYQVRFATKSNFSNALTNTYSSNSKTTLTVTGRAYSTKYYVQARTYKTSGGKNYYSAWSSSKQVTTASVYPSKTSITSVKANNNGFDVTVSKVSNATGYQIRFATKSNFSNALTNTYSSNSKTTLTVTGRAYDTKYYVQARTYKTVSGKNYYSAWSSSKQVTTDSLYPDKTSISSVKANNNGFDVTVSKVSNATGYQIRFATKSNFSNALTNTYSSNSKTTLTVTGRAYDTKYYVQARTYKTVSGKNYYSAWSSSKQVTTDSLYPDNTTITAVKTNKNGFDVTVSKVSNAAGYQVRFATKSNFSNALTNTYSSNSKTTLTVTGRAYETKYYIQARTYKTVNGKNYYSSWSASKYITTVKGPNYPDAPTVTSVTGIINGFTVNWQAISGVTGFQVQFATKSDFSNAATQSAGASASSKTITGRAGDCKYYVRVRVYKNIGGVNYYSYWSSVKNVTTQSNYSENLKKAGFPDSYIDDLVALHNKYPNWIFKPLITGINWSTAVNNERTPHSQQLIQQYSGNNNKGYYCTCSSCYKNGNYVIQEASNWVSASKTAVEYYMDPRNFLNEQGIFQFESSEYNGTQTQAGVEAILKGTWMYNSTIKYKNSSGATQTINKKYSQAIMEASNKSGLSAYYLASKIRQEVGGSSATAGGASGTVSGYKGIYNYYNINANTGATDGLKWAAASSKGYYTNCNCWVRKSATTSSSQLVLLPQNTKVTVKSETSKQSDGYTWYNISVTYGGKTYNGYIRSDLVDYAAAASYGRPWNTPYKSIIYGAQWIADNYDSQPTGYLQKFNVNPASGNELYSHEYMANVQAAAAESKTTYNAYKAADIMNVTKTFSIPVFKNMP